EDPAARGIRDATWRREEAQEGRALGAHQVEIVVNAQLPRRQLPIWELGVGAERVMLAIRMRRVGSKKKPYFRVVVTEAKSARESSFVENVGTYNPRSKPAVVEINKERIQHWIKKGAQPSDSVRTLLAKHLTKDMSKPVEVPAQYWRARTTGR